MQHPALGPFAQTIFQRTYAFTPDETWDGCAKRVAQYVLGDDDILAHRVYRAIAARKIMPGGRYLSNAGRDLAQLSNCFLMIAEDSREGWAELVKIAIMALSTHGGVGTEYSQVRPRGAAIKRMGGTASGPVALMCMLNEVARHVMAGGKRRSALWAGLNWQHSDVEEFVHAKDWEPFTRAIKARDFNFPALLDMTNISVGLDDEFFKRVSVGDKVTLDFYHRTCKSMCKTGEPGFSINLGDRAKEVARNPCQPGWATVLTPHGIRTFDDIKVDSLIWGGSEWVRVLRKEYTGTKVVSEYRTTAGVFVGTAEHRVIEDGERIEACNAAGIDQCLGPTNVESTDFDPQDVMDGLVLGDGSVHKASQGLVYLLVGQNDQEYFDSEVRHLFTRQREGLNPGAWEINTTVSAEELPRTWLREVPERFFYGDKRKMRGFLRGLFSANGGVAHGGRRIDLKQSSLKLIRQVQMMLSALGIRSYITTNKPVEIEHKNGVYESKQSYDLNISKDRHKFVELVGAIQARKNVLHDVTKCGNGKLTYNINEVVDIGEEKVWDIEVDNPEHTYWTGGMLVSNCNEVVSHLSGDCCNLLSINFARIASIDELEELTDLGTRFLIKGLDKGWLPHPLFSEVRQHTRRIGLGLMGLHEWCLQRGKRYESSEELGKWLAVWQQASDGVAKPHGCVGVRAIAPTGTIGILGETTTGIEPIYCTSYLRRYLGANHEWQEQYVLDPTAARLVEQGIKPSDIEDSISLSKDVERRFVMQAFVQGYVDQAISSTVNLPEYGEEGNNNARKFAATLLKYLPKLRGITVYPDGARPGQPITPVPWEEAVARCATSDEHEQRCVGGVCGI